MRAGTKGPKRQRNGIILLSLLFFLSNGGIGANCAGPYQGFVRLASNPQELDEQDLEKTRNMYVWATTGTVHAYYAGGILTDRKIIDV